MAQVLSLKELRDSNALKAEIRKIEDEKQQLLDQLERQKQLEKKLREDLLDHKKDFDHLEQQFDHFAGIEADFEALQQEVQMERLERLIADDKKEAQTKALVQKAKEDIKAVQSELKELKKLDPTRLKRQVTDLKKKNQQQATDNKNLNTALVNARKELKEVSAEKDKLDAELQASRAQLDYFWQSKDAQWSLFETSLTLKDEDLAEGSKRIRCLNNLTGESAISNSIVSGSNADGDEEIDIKATWLGKLEIPDEVTEEAGKRLMSIAAESDDEDN